MSRLGMLTPSSNTVVEPITQAIVAPMANVTAHYSRFKVTEITLSDYGLSQFNLDPFLAAADLLADARPDVIAWNGTSAAWRGFHEDETLCERISTQFGMPATASMLALNWILQQTSSTRFALVSPYTDDVQAAILANYRTIGFECIAESHLGAHVNFEFSQVKPERIRAQVIDVARSRPDAIIIVCTNLHAAGLVAELEAETGIPIYDSTSAVVWHALRLAAVDTQSLSSWGSLFTHPGLNA